jgi:DNA-binding NarL/FixJ family response regulator
VTVVKDPPGGQSYREWWIAVRKIRVVLADDHQLMIATVRQTLGEQFEVVGALEDGKRAVDAVLALNPDVLVMDISMPVLNGFQAAKQLQTAGCRAKIIFLTIYESRDYVDAAFSAGVSGYVTRHCLRRLTRTCNVLGKASAVASNYADRADGNSQ